MRRPRAKDRRTFLTAVASGGVGLSLLAGAARAQSPATATPPPAAASPSAKPGAKPPSAAAVALAATMRSFDATLSDDELAAIAAGIDAMRDLGPQLNPKKKRLANADEPVVTFAPTVFLT